MLVFLTLVLVEIEGGCISLSWNGILTTNTKVRKPGKRVFRQTSCHLFLNGLSVGVMLRKAPWMTKPATVQCAAGKSGNERIS